MKKTKAGRRSKTSRANLEAFIPERISDEPTVAIATRLPESLVAKIDTRRGEAKRSEYLRQIVTDALS